MDLQKVFKEETTQDAYYLDQTIWNDFYIEWLESKLEAAIAVNGCCTELKDKEAMTFEGYLIYKNILKDNGKYFLNGQEVDESAIKFMYNELVN